MKLDEMISKVGRKAKADDATTRRVIREAFASVREELSAANADSRITIPSLGTFVVRPGKEEGKNRILLNLSQKMAGSKPGGPQAGAGKAS